MSAGTADSPRALRFAAAPIATFVLLVALAASGCFKLSQPSPRIDQYRLEYSAQSPSGPRLPYILRFPPMEVGATYDRDPIVYREGEYKVGSYFYARWSSNPGNMIPNLLARDFANSNLYNDVQTSVSMVSPDFQVKGTIEEIEERIDAGACGAHLAVRITLAGTRGPRQERVRLSELYTADEPARCGDPSDLAAAMSRCVASISTRLQADVYRELTSYNDANPAKSRSK